MTTFLSEDPNPEGYDIVAAAEQWTLRGRELRPQLRRLREHHMSKTWQIDQVLKALRNLGTQEPMPWLAAMPDTLMRHVGLRLAEVGGDGTLDLLFYSCGCFAWQINRREFAPVPCADHKPWGEDDA